MSKGKSILVAVFLGLMAFVLFRAKVSRVKQEILNEYGEEMTVIVAQRDILPGVLIEADDIEIQNVPSVFAQPGVCAAVDEVISEMAVIPVRAGEQILRSKLAMEEGGYLSLKLGDHAAYRAITLKLDGEGGLVGLLHPGDFVDVVGIFESTSSGDSSMGNHAIVLVQATRVLAVNQQLSRIAAISSFDESKGISRGSGRNATPEDTWYITLEVSADKAQELSLAAQIAHLRCLLRQRTNKDSHVFIQSEKQGLIIKSKEVFDAGGKTIYPSGQPKPPFAE
ncbi:MAG: Flp pilus assembly protein CpaB [Verrucomicrobiae bacterium]|nr:Flp pilus assembly protein CpaB [Verrucomicrobiae bacterium]